MLPVGPPLANNHHHLWRSAPRAALGGASGVHYLRQLRAADGTGGSERFGTPSKTTQPRKTEQGVGLRPVKLLSLGICPAYIPGA